MAASFARYLGGKAVFGVCLLKASCAHGLKVLGVGCVIVGPAAGLTISSLITNPKLREKSTLNSVLLKSTPGRLWCLYEAMSEYSCGLSLYTWAISLGHYRDLVLSASMK